MIDSVSSTTTATYTTESNDTLDKDAFLQLMIAQLQNQDPLEPLDGSDYAAQLAQFSSLEQMQNINDTLNLSLDANYLLTQSINNTMTASMVGDEVKIAGDTVTYSGQDEVNFGYDLLAEAHEVTVKIYDKNGALVKTYDDLETDEGSYKLSWDFTDDNGNTVSTGDYTIEVEATNLNIEEMEVAQYFIGAIEAVRFSSSGTSLVVDGVEYDLSDVYEVLGSSNSVTSSDSDETSSSNTSSDDSKTEDDYKDSILSYKNKILGNS